MTLCITIEIEADRFASVLNGKVINVSRFSDFSLFHWKAHDVKYLKVPIAKFVFVDVLGEVKEIIESTQLKQRGINYKTAKRSDEAFTDEETADIAQAFELVEAFVAKMAPASGPASDPAATSSHDSEGEDQKQGDEGAGEEANAQTAGDAPADTDATDGVHDAAGGETAAEHAVGTAAGEESAGVQSPAVPAKKKRRH
jgi:hypothetical protein